MPSIKKRMTAHDDMRISGKRGKDVRDLWDGSERGKGCTEMRIGGLNMTVAPEQRD